jgi:sporulation protein YlmC with PRC-barrel domain
MKKISPLNSLISAAVIGVAVLGTVAATSAQAADPQSLSGYSDVVDLTAGGMIGQTVVSRNGMKLGQVSDLVIGKADKVSYAVISVEKARDKRVVIPYQSLKVGPKVVTVQSDMSSADAVRLPEYEPKDFTSIRTASRG